MAMKDLECEGDLKEDVVKLNTEMACGDQMQGYVHNIGFHITETTFYEEIYICFDHRHETTLFTFHILKGKNLNATDKGNRPGFKVDRGFFSTNFPPYYTESLQDEFFFDFLGKNITKGEDFLVKGHLTPDADFSLHNEAQATYYYINVIPQWQITNNGNWKVLEGSIQDLASKHGNDFKIWTGSDGILTLGDENNNDKEIFLGLSDKDFPQKIIPVPARLWKVVQNTVDSRSVAFVSVNNPFINEKEKEICTNICDQIKWLNQFSEELRKGQTYCCEVNDLKTSIPNVPDLGDISLLAE